MRPIGLICRAHMAPYWLATICVQFAVKLSIDRRPIAINRLACWLPAKVNIGSNNMASVVYSVALLLI